MALINCPECNKEISDKVKACPHCGYPFEEQTPANENMQKVELSSVNLQPRNPAKIKKIMFWIGGVAIIAIISITAMIFIKSLTEKKAFNQYIDNLNLASTTMLTGGAKAEGLNNLTAKVWTNAIYEDSDPTTDKFTKKNGRFVDDFNEALTTFFYDTTTKSTMTTIEYNQDSVRKIMKDLQNPPEGLEKCYETITDMYAAYNGLTGLALNPTGSLTTFSQSKNEKVDAFLDLLNKLEAQIPEKK